MPFFQNKDISLFYTDQGTGQPILLLHGWACDSHDWSFQVPTLLRLGLRVIALDHRGHGRSSAPEETSVYKLHYMVDDVLALLTHLNTGPVVLAGHSMSTLIGSIFAAEHPEMVKALVLVHPIYSGISPMLPILARNMRAEPEKIPELCADVFDKIMWTADSPEWLKTWVRRRILGSPPQAILGCVEGCNEVAGTVTGETEEAKELMQRRKAPRLALCTLESAPGWEKALGVREGVDEVHYLPYGTFTHMIKPEEVNKIIVDWLKKIEII